MPPRLDPPNQLTQELEKLHDHASNATGSKNVSDGRLDVKSDVGAYDVTHPCDEPCIDFCYIMDPLAVSVK
jgi:hypothetical protein